MSVRRILIVPICALIGGQALAAYGQTPADAPTPVPPVAHACSRPLPGTVIHQPPALFSHDGVLDVRFSYQTTTDSVGRQLFCFMTPEGLENPTLHVNPGDTLNITVTNNTPTNPVGETTEPYNPPNCGDASQQTQDPSQSNGMTGGSMNIHYHGTNTSPACHEDNVVKTLINSNHTFQYNVHFPTDEPPGLYWYHPHVHGLAELAVQGGGEGALVVDGVNNVQPAVAGLRNRIIVIRDQPLKTPMSESSGGTEGGIPQNDLTVNYVSLDTTVTVPPPPALPVTSYTPALIRMAPGERQFWRVCNCTSDAPLDLEVRFDGVAQTIQLVGIDAVPVNSQEGPQPGQLVPVTHFRLPPASRVEFLVDAPASGVKTAQLVTRFIDSGPIGDDLPTRPLLTIQTVNEEANNTVPDDDRIAPFTGLNTRLQRFAGIENETPAITRTVYFDELEDGTAFFVNASGCVTAAGAQCPTQPYALNTKFSNNNPPAIITTQGTVEKWIVQNRARENHELHQHQIHFKVLSQDNFEEAPGIKGQFLDMVEIPYCNGTGPGCPAPFPWPQVELLMDFRGPDIGDFVFHCHILGHEDRGMMAIERVVPRSGQ